MTASIEAAASALAHARARAEQSAAALIEATAAQSQVKNRIAECEAARQEIRRQRGSSAAIDDESGRRLALLDADIETLREMLPERDGSVAAAKAADAAARQAVAHAEHVLATERDAEMSRRLVEHAEKVASVLLATLAELAGLDKAAGRRQSWTPSRELAETIQRHHLNGVRR